jgi:hypothetical protein
LPTKIHSLSVLALVSLIAITTPFAPVRAQSPAAMLFWTAQLQQGTPISQIVADMTSSATGGNGADLASAGNIIAALVRANPGLADQFMSAVAQLPTTTTAGSAAKANLISGLLSDQNLGAAVKTTLARSMVATGNASLLASVTVLVAKDNINNTLATIETALAQSTNGALVQNVVAAIKASPDAPANLSTTLAADIANNPLATVAAKAGAQAGNTGTPIVTVGGPTVQTLIILPSPQQTVTGSVN